MNLWSNIASTLLLAAGLSAGQTPSGDSPSTSAPPAGRTAAPSSAPDLSFKPDGNPASLPPSTPPTTLAPGKTPAASPAAGGSAPAAGGSGPAASGSSKQGKAGPAAATGGKPAGNLSPTYVLGPNDIVAVSVFDEPHLPGSYVILPDGQMSMPLIGDFKAAGLTITELNDLITEKLKAVINEPTVNVQLLRNNSKQYTVMGGVNKSGAFPLLRQTTILDAMAACGGFRDFANTKKIYLMRGSKKYYFNYNEVKQGKHMEQNIPIEDGDYIFVPD